MGSLQSKPSKNYEKLLTTLQNDIKSRQQSIQRLKTFNRSCQVHLVLFSSIFYGGYTVLLFLQYKLGTSQSFFNKSSFAFLVLFPIGIFYFKKLVAGVFNFFVSRRQTVLKAKQAELKDRIEELKIETRYYQTKDLIEKYDKSSKTETETENENKNEVTRRNIKTNNSTSSPSSTVTTVSQSSQTSKGVQNNQKSPSQYPNTQHLNQFSPPQHPSIPLNYRPSPPPFRSPTWMDRFMDALIGDDSRNQKYALICSQCFNHNGLATPELFETVRYRCPNCGFFNFNKRSIDVKSSSAVKSSSENKRIEEVTDEPAKSVDKPTEFVDKPTESVDKPIESVDKPIKLDKTVKKD